MDHWNSYDSFLISNFLKQLLLLKTRCPIIISSLPHYLSVNFFFCCLSIFFLYLINIDKFTTQKIEIHFLINYHRSTHILCFYEQDKYTRAKKKRTIQRWIQYLCNHTGHHNILFGFYYFKFVWRIILKIIAPSFSKFHFRIFCNFIFEFFELLFLLKSDTWVS